MSSGHLCPFCMTRDAKPGGLGTCSAEECKVQARRQRDLDVLENDPVAWLLSIKVPTEVARRAPTVDVAEVGEPRDTWILGEGPWLRHTLAAAVALRYWPAMVGKGGKGAIWRCAMQVSMDLDQATQGGPPVRNIYASLMSCSLLVLDSVTDLTAPHWFFQPLLHQRRLEGLVSIVTSREDVVLYPGAWWVLEEQPEQDPEALLAETQDASGE